MVRFAVLESRSSLQELSKAVSEETACMQLPDRVNLRGLRLHQTLEGAMKAVPLLRLKKKPHGVTSAELEPSPVKARGKNKTFQTVTDEHGVYEVYGLPPGKYLIAPEMPYGWIIDKDESFPTVSERPVHSKLYKAFTLRPKRHAVIDFAFKIDNVVERHVYDENGRP